MRSSNGFRVLAAVPLLLVLGRPGPVHAQKESGKDPTAGGRRLLGQGGDFDTMRKRRVIRALVVYNKTNYFIDKGTPRGITYEALKLFEDEINRKYKTGNLKIHVAFIPVGRKDLASALLEGRGDIAAAGLTVTPERLKLVDFSDPALKNVSEIVVSGPASPPIASVDDLSAREVYVRKGSIWHESLEKLNADLAKRGKTPAKLRFAPDNLEDEDLLEMLNAGLVQYVVVDDYLARFWAESSPRSSFTPT